MTERVLDELTASARKQHRFYLVFLIYFGCSLSRIVSTGVTADANGFFYVDVGVAEVDKASGVS